MKNRSGNEVRALFLEYFKKHGHMIEPGASLIPHDDPTLLWINAGVAALKKYFDGTLTPASNRIANAQKSIRTNDIENVGKTARHHTFFEMLGNFSIGDYFKKEAIQFAWKFLTSEEYMGFDKNKLYVSVFSDDQEAFDIWVNDCHVDISHISKVDDNFWQIGEGPCGPNTEIFYDRGIKYDPQNIGEKLFFEDLENDRYIEIWNVVFSQFDAKDNLTRSQYKELPQKNIDTGMGLERLVCLIQDGETNFDTDLFLPTIHECEKFSKLPYNEPKNKMAYRVIADHIRTVCFALADGALFANEGRGYVLRRVLRRAVRYGKSLEIEGAFMYRLVGVVSECMNAYYPYLSDKVTQISNLVKIEEERFHSTLNDGEKLLKDVLKQNSNSKKIDGIIAFKLYDTYGFPIELTLEIANEQGYELDVDTFEVEMDKQKNRARNARGDIESMSSQSKDLLNFTTKSDFIGYDLTKCEAKVIALFKNGEQVDSLSEDGEVVFDQSIFYAESGGQISDIGYVYNKQFDGIIQNVYKAPHKQHLHKLHINSGKIHVNDKVSLAIDSMRRDKITCNHSCTHLLQSALKSVVGEHIQQAGSFVCDTYFRFDFTHFEKITREQMNEMEVLINTYIANNYLVSKIEMPIEDAKKSGATALFDEKYGEIVRVVRMGDVSNEFCGGCHVSKTREIGICHLSSEESIGSGVRRIIGTSGFDAYTQFVAMQQQLVVIADSLKQKSIDKISDKVERLSIDFDDVKKECAKLRSKVALAKSKELRNEMVNNGELKVLCKQFIDEETTDLKEVMESIIANENKALIFFVNVSQGRIVFLAKASKEAVKAGIHCGNIVKQAAELCSGNGGGRADFAQAGGKYVSQIAKCIEFVKNIKL